MAAALDIATRRLLCRLVGREGEGEGRDRWECNDDDDENVNRDTGLWGKLFLLMCKPRRWRGALVTAARVEEEEEKLVLVMVEERP
jgi:hypothetical protein